MIFYNEIPVVTFIEYSKSIYGEPKLDKPKELKGISQILSIPIVHKKCTCPVFLENNNIWIKCSDYFSTSYLPTQEELGMPLNYFAEKFLGKSRPQKFIYGDAWGDIVFRNEAWLKLENIVLDIKNNIFLLDIKDRILRQIETHLQFQELELSVGVWSRFIENIVLGVDRYLKT